MILFTIILPFDNFSHKYKLFNFNLNNCISASEHLIYKVSFSESKNSKDLSKYSGLELYSEIENLDPDDLLNKFETNDNSWLLGFSTNQLELIMDQLRLILSLQLNRHFELLNQPQSDLPSSEENINDLEESNNFINKLLGYILTLLIRIFEKRQSKFDLDSNKIIESNKFSKFELIRREVVFYQENKDLLRNFFFIFKCKISPVKDSQLCNYITKAYSDFEQKYLFSKNIFSEYCVECDNEWEDIKEDSSSFSESSIFNKRYGKNRFIFKSKAKQMRIRYKNKSKLKSKPKRRIKLTKSNTKYRKRKR